MPFTLYSLVPTHPKRGLTSASAGLLTSLLQSRTSQIDAFRLSARDFELL